MSSSHLTFKILVVGDEDVGKTTIVNHYTLMPASFGSTVGIEFQSRMVALSADALNDNLTISKNASENSSENSSEMQTRTPSTPSTMCLQKYIKHYDHVKCYFWDTSGSPRYQSLSHTYYRNISAAIVVFDLSNEKTCTDLHSYIHRIIQKNSCTHKHPILVIGNKFDKRKINKTRIQIYDDLCHEFPNENIKYAEVSCLDKVYIDDKLNTNNKFNTVFNCATCANSSDLHSAITSFLQFTYDSAIKPHFYNPNAISAIGCSGINGSSRYFTIKKEQKEDFKRVVADEDVNSWKFARVPSLKTPRQCCDEHYYSYSSSSGYSSSAGCSSCSIL
jgi:small GTP-binding protein